MKYKEIDSLLNAFTKRHGLYVHRMSHYETPVRVIPIVDDKGDVYSIHVTIEGDKIILNGWNNKIHGNKSEIQKCQKEKLDTSLEKVYRVIEKWIVSNGSSRTPVV